MLRIFNQNKYYYFSKKELNIIKSLKGFFDDGAYKKGLDYIDSLNLTNPTKFDIVTKIYALLFSSKLGLNENAIVIGRNIFKDKSLGTHTDADREYLRCYTLNVFRALHGSEVNQKINNSTCGISEKPEFNGVSPNILQLFTMAQA